MGLPVLLYIRSVIWRTVLQPIVEVSEVDSVVAAEVVDAVAVEAAVVEVVEVEAKTKKNGFPLPSLALVKDGKIKSLEEIYLFSLPIKEFEIIDFFLGPSLKDEVLK